MAVLQEFKKFIMRGNVVDLAVGVVIGAAFGKIVDSLVKDIFMPIVGLLTGGFDVSKQAITYKDATLAWGNFLQTIITFVIVGWCMFMVVKGMNALHKYVMKDADQKPDAEMTPTEKLLAEIRDLLKARETLPPPPSS
jgi:large conductance mechanosensitive channel